MLMISHDLNELDDDHRDTLDRAIRNILNTKVAQFMCAQIFDGLPTKQSLLDSFDYVKGHPVHAMGHREICPGAWEKVRASIDKFDLYDLDLEREAIQRFQGESIGSGAFNLRLIELVAIACHEAGARAYAINRGTHKHKLYQDWRDDVLEEKENGIHCSYEPPVAAFAHRAYQYPERYPRGIADVAGYWAESKIFGGVVVFDRGEAEDECNSMWIYGDLIRGPKTLYPPTPEQFEALVNFLTMPVGGDLDCPLPIHGKAINRPRWDPHDAFAHRHIFRHKFERKLAPEKLGQVDVQSSIDWPELEDKHILLSVRQHNPRGEHCVDRDEYAAVKERIKNITPSSPVWGLFSNYSQGEALKSEGTSEKQRPLL